MVAGVHSELCDREEDMDGKVLSRRLSATCDDDILVIQ